MSTNTTETPCSTRLSFQSPTLATEGAKVGMTKGEWPASYQQRNRSGMRDYLFRTNPVDKRLYLFCCCLWDATGIPAVHGILLYRISQFMWFTPERKGLRDGTTSTASAKETTSPLLPFYKSLAWTKHQVNIVRITTHDPFSLYMCVYIYIF